MSSRFSTCLRGTTLLETLGAATLILFVLLALLGTITVGLRGTQTAEKHQEAVYVARRLFDLVRDRGLYGSGVFNNPPEARVVLSADPFALDFPEDSKFTRRIVTEQHSTDPDNFESKLYRIEVAVYWNEKNRENHFEIVGLARTP